MATVGGDSTRIALLSVDRKSSEVPEVLSVLRQNKLGVLS
jgi:hypothetical protein